MGSDLKINLLKRRRGISEQEYLRERRIFVWSVVAFMAVVMVIVVLFVVEWLGLRELNKVRAEKTRLQAKSRGLQEISAGQVYLKNRLKLIDKFLQSRVRKREALERVFAIDTPGVVVLGASFETEDKLDLRLSADSVVAFDRVYKFFEEDDFFHQVVNLGTSRGDDGTYVLQLELTVPRSREGGGE